MKRCYDILCLDTHTWMTFVSTTAYEAMKSLIYYLNLSHNDAAAEIMLLGGGRTLSVVHSGRTYACMND